MNREETIEKNMLPTISTIARGPINFCRMALFSALRHTGSSISGAEQLILLYHDVAPEPEPRLTCVSVSRFRQHLNVITNIALRSSGANGDKPSVLVTFDDACRGVLEWAADPIEEAGVSAQVFVVGRWSSRGRAGFTEGTRGLLVNQRKRCLVSTEIRSLRRRGFRFGAHGWSHSRLTHLDPERLRRELVASRRWLEDVLGESVEDFAYPYGDFNRHVIEAVREAGFTTAYTTVNGFRGPSVDALAVPRMYVHESCSPPELAAMFQRWYPDYTSLRERVKAHIRLEL